jgi:hypothetical protein
VVISRLGQQLTVGRWWEPGFQAEWTAALTALAAQYDSNPLIADVSNTSCSTQTDEPWVQSLNLSAAAQIAAGYTDAAYRACLANSPNDHAAWTQTRIDATFNLFHGVEKGTKADPKFTQQIIAQDSAVLGTQLEVSNHSITDVPIARNLAVFNAAAALIGMPCTWQTIAPSKALNWDATIRYAVSLGCTTSIELWNTKTGWPQIPATTLLGWAALIKGNPLPQP